MVNSFISPRSPSPEETERYRRELIELSRLSSPSAAAEKSPTETAAIAPAAAIPAEAPAEVPATEKEAEPAAFTGSLRVFAFAGTIAQPLSGVRVTVYQPTARGNILFAGAVTDMSGLTPSITLPSVDPTLTLSPDEAEPYVYYTVEVYADGFRPARYEQLPLYGDNALTQPAGMLPPLPGETDTVVVVSGAPKHLTGGERA